MRDLAAMPGRIETFLAAHPDAGRCEVTGYRIMTGGYSRQMARVEVRWEDGRTETLVMRGDPPAAEALLHTDRDQEWAVLRRLTELGATPMPAARYYAADPAPFGTKALFIEHLDRRSLQARFEAGLDPAGLVEPLADLFASVAVIEPGQIPDLPAADSWEDHIGALIDEWNGIDHAYPESLPIIRYVGAYLAAHPPPPLPLRLVHGDLQAANVLGGGEGEDLQLVDWEFARIGDPREDLGWYNSYSTAAPPNVYGAEPERFLARYRERTGFDETTVNPLTVGYFTILATVKVLAGLYQALTGLVAGEVHGANVAFSTLSASFGHQNFVNAVEGIAAAVSAVEEAS